MKDRQTRVGLGEVKDRGNDLCGWWKRGMEGEGRRDGKKGITQGVKREKKKDKREEKRT